MTTMRDSVGDFLRGRTLLLTGGTGFLGKVIVQRLLRVAPDVERIYLLIRPSRLTPPERFEAEVVRSGAFEALAALYGDRWPSLVRDKVVPVAGDVSRPFLGMDEDTYAALTRSVEIVINSAASVAFDAPLDEALRHNTHSVQHGVAFARACRSASLVQVSTAYVAGQRTGRIPEAALEPDVSAREMAAIDEGVAAVRDEARARHVGAREVRAQLVAFGMTRARELGWHDSYTYTKALGEMTLERHRGDVPTAIVRPTIIESSLRDPVPGWLENLNVGDPIFVEFGRGRMPDFPLRRDAVFDIVPVDLVANAVLGVLPRVGDMRQRAGYYTVGFQLAEPAVGRAPLRPHVRVLPARADGGPPRKADSTAALDVPVAGAVPHPGRRRRSGERVGGEAAAVPGGAVQHVHQRGLRLRHHAYAGAAGVPVRRRSRRARLRRTAGQLALVPAGGPPARAAAPSPARRSAAPRPRAGARVARCVTRAAGAWKR